MQGGSLEDPFGYAFSVGIATVEAYGSPPGGVDGQRLCRGDVAERALAAGQGVRLLGPSPGWRAVQPRGSEGALMEAVSRGPVAVAFEARPSFRAYGGGVYAGRECEGTVEALNHALVSGWWWRRGTAALHHDGSRHAVCVAARSGTRGQVC